MSTMTTTVVILLLIIVLLVFLNSFFSVQMESSANQLSSINNQLKTYVTSMDNYSKMMISDTALQKNVLKYKNSPASYTESDRNDLKVEMRKFLQSTSFFHSATVYSLDYASLSSTAVASHSTNLEDLAIQNKPIFIYTKKYSNFEVNSEINALSLIRPFYEISSGAPLGFLEITITEKDISDIYKNNTSDTSKFLIVDTDGNVVSTDGTYELNSTYQFAEQFQEAIASGYKVGPSFICFVSQESSLDWYIINEVKLSAFYQPIYLILVITIIITTCFLLASIVLSNTISKTITKPLYQLIQHIQRVKLGDWAPINHTSSDLDINLLFQEFDSMILSQQKLTQELVTAQKDKDKLSLDLLQQQVNPHFLYNTLDNIESLATLDEKEKLRELVMNLSEFYRHSLSGGNFIITIQDEIDLTNAYVNIMQIRYVNKFHFAIHCPNELKSYNCLKLLLQPIIENSIYHGIKESRDFGEIQVTITEHNDAICFVIEDLGPGADPESLQQLQNGKSAHFGIKSVRKRIEMYYGKGFGIEMENKTPIGFKTTITIPKQKGKEYEI